MQVSTPFISKAPVPCRLYRERDKTHEKKEDTDEHSPFLSRTQKTDIPIDEKKSITRLEKIKITMTFEKLYFYPSHYAGYSAMDNLTCAVKPNFLRREIVNSNRKTRTRHTDHCAEN